MKNEFKIIFSPPKVGLNLKFKILSLLRAHLTKNEIEI